MMVVEIYCSICKSNPCHCGEEYKFYAREGKEKLTKAINGFSIEDVFRWLEKKNYITDKKDAIFEEFKKEYYK